MKNYYANCLEALKRFGRLRTEMF